MYLWTDFEITSTLIKQRRINNKWTFCISLIKKTTYQLWIKKSHKKRGNNTKGGKFEK